MRSLRETRNAPTHVAAKIFDWGWVRDILKMWMQNNRLVSFTWFFEEGKFIEGDVIINGYFYNWQRRDNVFYRNSHTEIQAILLGGAMYRGNI